MTNLPRRATAALLLLALFAAAPGRAPAPGVVAHLTPAAASQEAADAAAIRPFKITVPSSVLTDLKERLRRPLKLRYGESSCRRAGLADS